MSHPVNLAYQQSIVDAAGRFARENIFPYAAEFEINEALPGELIKAMGDKGYLAASFPREYAGLGLDPCHYGLFTEEIGKGCCSTRGLITVHTSLVGETLLKWGNEDQKRRWLPLMAKGEKLACFALSEPDTGSDAKALRTTCRPVDGMYVLDGVKKWITCGDIADLFLIIARDEDRISAFIVERGTEGLSTKPIKGLLAGRASHMAEVNLNKVMVPRENLIGAEGGGFSYIVNTALDHGRYSIAWAGVAIAQSAVDAMVNYARTRYQFGKELHHFQLIQGMIADAVTKVHSARALCLHAGRLRKEGHEDAMVETSIAKYFSSRIAMEIAVDAVQVHGANGCHNGYPVERLFREAKVLEIIEGTSQIQQQVIAQYALNRYYEKK